jgi:hypothetical protein
MWQTPKRAIGTQLTYLIIHLPKQIIGIHKNISVSIVCDKPEQDGVSHQFIDGGATYIAQSSLLFNESALYEHEVLADTNSLSRISYSNY